MTELKPLRIKNDTKNYASLFLESYVLLTVFFLNPASEFRLIFLLTRLFLW